MDLHAALATAQQQSVQLYLRRQQLEGQAQTLQIQIRQCEHALLALDGEIAMAQRLIEQSKAEDAAKKAAQAAESEEAIKPSDPADPMAPSSPIEEAPRKRGRRRKATSTETEPA